MMAEAVANAQANGFQRSQSKKTVGQSIVTQGIEYSRTGCAPATLQNLKLGKISTADGMTKRMPITSGEGASTLTFQAQSRPRVALTSQVTKDALENVKLGASLEATATTDGKQRTLINLFPD